MIKFEECIFIKVKSLGGLTYPSQFVIDIIKNAKLYMMRAILKLKIIIYLFSNI